MGILIELGADVNQETEQGYTALLAAIRANHVEAVQALLAAGAHVRTGEGVNLAAYVQNRTIAKGRKILEMLEKATSEQVRKTPED